MVYLWGMDLQEMEFRLNKRIALFENLLNMQINLLEAVSNKNDLVFVYNCSFKAIQLGIERKSILGTPNVKFKKGGIY